MPMGLRNSLAIFMQTMYNLFIDMLDKVVVVFMDDILVYSNWMEEYFNFFKKVFTQLCKDALSCKLKK